MNKKPDYAERYLNERKWKNKILNICKYCKHFTDLGKKAGIHKRYQCDKKECIIYDAYNCRKTDRFRIELEMSI